MVLGSRISNKANGNPYNGVTLPSGSFEVFRAYYRRGIPGSSQGFGKPEAGDPFHPIILVPFSPLGSVSAGTQSLFRSLWRDVATWFPGCAFGVGKAMVSWPSPLHITAYLSWLLEHKIIVSVLGMEPPALCCASALPWGEK